MTDVDVIIVGGGPTGLMLAAELRLAGVRPLVLELRPQIRQTPKANGLGGQILRLLHYRGLLDRFEAACAGPAHPAPRYPFGGVHLDFSHLADPPLRGLTLPQPELERLLDERARELDADIRRGHETAGVHQDNATVTADVRGPDGTYQVTARYLVGCDGARSGIRDMAGIPFPGTTYPEVNRLGQVALPDSLTRRDNGDLDVPGLGTIQAGAFTRTDRGVFGFGWLTPEVALISTTEEESTEIDDDAPMTLAELQDSIRHVLGAELPLGQPIRLSRYQFQARLAERFRDGRIMLAGDAAHLFPATGVALNAGMLDTVNLAWKLAADIHGWASPDLLDTYHHERHFAGTRTLLHTHAQVALRRGQDAAADALRELFVELVADEQPSFRVASLIAGTDIRYQLPSPNEHPLTGTFAPDLTLHTDHGTTSVAELMHAARPVLLDLADRPDLRETARDWEHRVDVHTAKPDHRPADALLIRPDAHIAWAAALDEPANTLREALTRWFGTPESGGLR
ncbi:2-polyprenyl-6-methoxyphenol hydroxylase-like FAD-dependent oxidoreductase [Saccharothrix ecbatanensis]|uniref:2-polyprenyl-6-methoxyphenol hydroxylase-like FAD-dependent oxidoreductase n=1 Tax=Saccharothrix ecbatanensis TaxID=1105145 RepID=A0A7W9HEF0_9PSEU|nr:FAD-dependent monooxygenase [Saccharothrix ecbatanensis]MBB5800466.1 2-polyprenyl-6-methoxyphenol hydroxylase-like FAD-dependent oxidoreductase [Saccharothrix ecbatanensis]